MRISLLTVTRNRKWSFPLAIKNFKQFRDEIEEWVIIDDGFEDLSGVLPKDDKIKYIQIEHVGPHVDNINGMVKDWYDFHKAINRLPLGYKRNLGVRKCKGEVIVMLDDDDVYHPNYIKDAVSYLDDYDCVYSNNVNIWDTHKQRMYRCGNGYSVAEGTLVFKIEFWIDSGFKDSDICEEGVYFVSGRRNVKKRSDSTLYTGIQHGHNVSNKISFDISEGVVDLRIRTPQYSKEFLWLMEFFRYKKNGTFYGDSKYTAELKHWGWSKDKENVDIQFGNNVSIKSNMFVTSDIIPNCNSYAQDNVSCCIPTA